VRSSSRSSARSRATAGRGGRAAGGSRGTGVEHAVVAESTHLAPGNASSVDASTPQLADASAVQAALTEDEVAVVRVSELRFEALNRTVAATPGVADRTDDEQVAATLYVEYEGDAYRVTVRKRWLV